MTAPERLPGGGALVIEVGGTRRYLPVTAVVEVMREVRIIRVPGAVPAVAGMVNHRGRILTVADGGLALGLGETVGERRQVVVAEVAGQRFGIAVDSVIELTPEARTGLAELDLPGIAAAIFT